MTGQEVWTLMQGDPAMIDAITVGQFEDLMTLVTGVITNQEDVKKAVPVGVLVRLTKAEGLSDQMDSVREILGVQALKKALDEACGWSR